MTGRRKIGNFHFSQITSKMAKINTNLIIALKINLDIVLVREDVHWEA